MNPQEIAKLIQKTLMGEKASQDLFDALKSEINDFYCNKIFHKAATHYPNLEGLNDLSQETFEKALAQIAKTPNAYNQKSFDFKDHCLTTAERVWEDSVQKSNECDEKSFNAFFNICRLPLLGFFRGKLGPDDTTSAEELCNVVYIEARTRKKDKPFIPEDGYSFYSYLKYVSEAKFLVMRHRSSESSLIKSGDENTLIKDDDTPEDMVIAKETIRNEIERAYHLINVKLATLQFCAIFSKPHHFLAFGFNKWLKWKRKEVFNRCSEKKFDDLSRKLLEETLEAIWLSYQEIDIGPYFSPHFEKIGKRTEEVYTNREYDWLFPYRNTLVKDLSFKVFYGSDPEQEPSGNPEEWPKEDKDRYAQKISDWSNKVRLSTMNALNVRDNQP